MIKDHRVYKPNKQKNKVRILLFIIKIVFIFLLLQIIITNFLISSYSVNSLSMEPAIKQKDRVFTSPLNYGIFFPFSNQRIGGFQKPKRGDIVLIQPPFIQDLKFPFSLLEGLKKIFTLTNIKSGNNPYIKRIIGIPGDTIKLENYMAYIKPQNNEQFYAEKELIKIDYDINVKLPINPHELKNENFLSGNLKEIVLNENEYFILGDNRTSSNDSRTWGKIHYSIIISKIIFRYFPLTKMGIPK